MARLYKGSNSISALKGEEILYFIAFCICTLAFFMYFHVRTHIFTCELSTIWFFSDEKSNSKQQEVFFGEYLGWGTAWKSNKMFIRATCTSNCSCLWSAILSIFLLENSTILCCTIDIICLCYVSVQWFRHSQHEFILCSKKIIFLFFALFVHWNIGIHKHQFLWLILLDPLAMYHSIFFNNAEMLFVIIILVCYPHCCCCYCCCWFCLLFYYWINFQDVRTWKNVSNGHWCEDLIISILFLGLMLFRWKHGIFLVCYFNDYVWFGIFIS